MPDLDKRVRRFFDGFSKFLNSAKTTRELQTKYFHARRAGDGYDATKYLKDAQAAEKDLDALVKQFGVDLDTTTPVQHTLFS